MSKSQVKNPNNCSKEELKQLLAKRKRSKTCTVETSEEVGSVPIALTQQGIWISEHLGLSQPVYHVALCLTIHGNLDLVVLQKALQLIAERHSILRTRLERSNIGLPLLVETKHLPLIKSYDLRGFGLKEYADLRQSLLEKEAKIPFQLTDEPAFRAMVILEPEYRVTLLLVLHHLILDGSSVAVLLQELSQAYQSLINHEPISWRPLSTSYMHWAQTSRRQYEQGYFNDSQQFWLQKLHDAPPVLSLPTDFPRPLHYQYAGTKWTENIPPSITQSLDSLSSENNITSFALYLTAFFLLLHAYAGQDDIVIGCPYVNRDKDYQKDLIGMFVNTLALRATLKDHDSLLDFIKSIQMNVVECFEHGAFPFPKLLEILNPERVSDKHPVFQVMFAFQNIVFPINQFCGNDLQAHLLDLGTSKFDLTFQLICLENTWQLEIEYNTTLFHERTIAQLARHYIHYLTCLPHSLSQPIKELSVLDAQDWQWIALHQGQSYTYPTTTTLAELFHQAALLTPHKIALKEGDQTCTYEWLEIKSNQIAHSLQEITPSGLFIGLLIERSIDMVVAILAILKAGYAYLPLGVDWPIERINYCLNESKASHLISSTQYLTHQQLNAHPLTMKELEAQSFNKPSYPPPNQCTAQDLCYLIFTSGSTGIPKGVMVEHHSVINYLLWRARVFENTSKDIFLQKTPYTFDVSVWEIFLPLTLGATLILAEPNRQGDSQHLVDLIRQHQVSILHFVPSMLAAFLKANTLTTLPSIRQIITSGEALPPQIAQTVLVQSQASLYNLYGPTEGTIDCTYWQCERFAPTVLIGKPIDNTVAYVLDAHHRCVPPGAVGELYLGGTALARGYLDPGLTAQRFIHWSQKQQTIRLYKTGDLVRLTPTGDLEYLGRADNQVKMRGFRIELEEIAKAIESNPQVESAIAIAYRDSADYDNIACFYQLKPEVRLLNQTDLIAYCQTWLPPYMIPTKFIAVDTYPVTANGKLDKPALLTLLTQSPINTPITTEFSLEKQVLYIWSTLLKTTVQLDDNFFQLGGHSLLALDLINQLSETLQIKLTLLDLLASPSPRSICQRLLQNRGVSQNDDISTPFPLTEIQQAYWVGSTQELELSKMGAHFYAEIETDYYDKKDLLWALDQLVQRHPMLRTIIQDGLNYPLERESFAPPLYYFEAQGLSSEAQEEQRLQHRALLISKQYPLDSYPLFDVYFTALSSKHGRLHLSFSLLICDAQSIYIFLKELAHYLKEQTPLPPLSFQFRNYVLEHQKFRYTHAYQLAKSYWEQRYATLPLAPDLPRQTKEIDNNQVYRLSHRLTAQEWNEFKQIASINDITPSILLLTIFAEALAAWASSSHFTLNLTLFNREIFHPEVNQIMGDFTELNLLEFDGRATQSLKQRCQSVQKQLWQDLEHRQFGGLNVLRELAKRHNKPGEALMPIVFTSTLTQNPDLDASVVQKLGTFVFGASQTPQVLLDHQIYEYEGGLSYHWDIVAGAFPAELIQDMFDAYKDFIQTLLSNNSLIEQSISMTPPKHLLLFAKMNDTQQNLNIQPLHQPIFSVAKKYGNKIAVVSPEKNLDYQTVVSYAQVISGWLLKHQCAPETLVAIVMEKGWEQVCGVLGILGAGCAYLPLDPSWPIARLQQLIIESGIEYVITTPSVEARLQWPTMLKRYCVNEALLLNENSTIDRTVYNALEHLAYVIFTSGSTGKPKGVAISHKSAANTIIDINHRFHVTHADSVFAISELHFDLSVYDLFGLLAVGGTIVLNRQEDKWDPAYWYKLLTEHAITLWNSVPALLDMFIDYLETKSLAFPPSLRCIFLSGDWVPLSIFNKLKQRGSNALLIALGGATEASIWSNYYQVNHIEPVWNSIPYGYPLANQRYYILDEQLRSKPIYATGKLYIAGDGLAMGYWKDPGKTEERFIQHPTLAIRLYDTGDFARYLADGSIEFLGRNDTQVKIRGMRIELGEIEAIITQLPGIDRAIVIVMTSKQQERFLVAYIKLQCTQTMLTPEDIAKHCKLHLPQSMQPTFIFLLSQWPLTSNGKLDLSQLPQPSDNASNTSISTTYTTSIMETILSEIQTITGHSVLSPQQHLLRMGLTSIDMVKLINGLDKSLGRRLSLTQLYQHPTPQGIVELYEQGQGVKNDVALLDPMERDHFKTKKIWLRQDLQDPILLLKPEQRLFHLFENSLRNGDYIHFGDTFSIQTYVLIKTHFDAGIAPGLYYYHPIQYGLQLLTNNLEEFSTAYLPLIYAPLYEMADLALFFIADEDANRPLYGREATRFSILEAGSMAQAIVESAKNIHLRISHVGVMEFEKLRFHFKLKQHQALMHSILIHSDQEQGEL